MVEGAVARARDAGVTRIISVGTDVAHSCAAIDAASTHDGVWATAGVHPHDARQGVDGLAELLGLPRVVAVGECGLDYHYDNSPRAVLPRDVDVQERRRRPGGGGAVPARPALGRDRRTVSGACPAPWPPQRTGLRPASGPGRRRGQGPRSG